MDTQKFKGIFTALLTPFNSDDSINYDALAKLMEFNISAGVKGFYVGGSTGESMVMSIEERAELLQKVSAINHGRVTLIGHCGAIYTGHAIQLAKVAEANHYDAISAVAPFYYSFGYEAIKGYYLDIVNSVKTPMIIYNFPNSGSFTFTPAIADELFSKNDRFIGIKHTCQDLFTLERFKSLDREMIVYNGFDEMLVGGLAMGADGGIGSTYNFMPYKIINIYNLFRAGKIAEAQAAQVDVNNIIAELIKYGVFAAEKCVLTHMGIPMGNCRKPFLPISAEGDAAMAKIAKRLLSENK